MDIYKMKGCVIRRSADNNPWVGFRLSLGFPTLWSLEEFIAKLKWLLYVIYDSGCYLEIKHCSEWLWTNQKPLLSLSLQSCVWFSKLTPFPWGIKHCFVSVRPRLNAPQVLLLTMWWNAASSISCQVWICCFGAVLQQ